MKTNIREYGELKEVDIIPFFEWRGFDKDCTPDTRDRLLIVALNEGGHNCTEVDLLDVVNWVKQNKPELLKDSTFDTTTSNSYQHKNDVLYMEPEPKYTIDRVKLFELYMQEVDRVAEVCDWKTQFGPEEIVGMIVRILDNNPQLIERI